MWIFTAIGLLYCLYYVVLAITRLRRFYRGHFTKAKLPQGNQFQSAVITGAGDGIGKEYAKELARLGATKIVLIGRTFSKLEEVAEEIRTKHPNVDVRSVVADYSDVTIYDRLEQELGNVDVDVLINNVGASINVQKRLHEISRENIFKTININVVSTVLMSHIVLPKMVKKGYGIIVNMSSASAIFPPRMILYASTKYFVSRFSYGLRLQFQRFGVLVQEIEPFLVSTKMARFVKGPFVVSSEACARQSLKTLGHYDYTHGAVKHDVQGFLFSKLPESLLEHLMVFMEQRAKLAAEKKAATADKRE